MAFTCDTVIKCTYLSQDAEKTLYTLFRISKIFSMVTNIFWFDVMLLKKKKYLAGIQVSLDAVTVCYPFSFMDDKELFKLDIQL